MCNRPELKDKKARRNGGASLRGIRKTIRERKRTEAEIRNEQTPEVFRRHYLRTVGRDQATSDRRDFMALLASTRSKSEG